MKNTITQLYEEKANLNKEIAPFEKKKDALYQANKSNIDKRDLLYQEMNSLDIKFPVGILITGIVVGAIFIYWSLAYSSELYERIIQFIIGGVAVAFAIRNVILYFINKKKLINLQRAIADLNEELSEYDREVKNIDNDMAKYKNRIQAIDKELNRSKYEKNYVIVYAGAIRNERQDDDVRRAVIIDGYNHGNATPWLIVGVNPGFHTICVNYRHMDYTGYTSVINFRADDCSKIYACKKGDGIYLHTDPLYEFGELDNLLSSVSWDEKSRFPDKSIL